MALLSWGMHMAAPDGAISSAWLNDLTVAWLPIAPLFSLNPTAIFFVLKQWLMVVL